MRILLIDAAAETIERFRSALAASDQLVTSETATDPDLVVLGDGLGAEATAAALSRFEGAAPVLALVPDVAAAVAAIDAGATDALPWPGDARLLPVRLAAARRACATTCGVPDGLVACDTDGRLLATNAALRALSGRETLQGARLDELFGDASGPLPDDAAFLVDRHLARPDGGRLLVEIHGRRLPDGRLVAVVRDVDARRTRERQLSLTERLASLATLAAGVSHEINNPLSYVLANLDVLRDELSELLPTLDPRLAEDMRRLLHEMTEGARRVADVVRELRTFARADHELVGPVDVQRLLASALTIASSEVRRRARLVRDLQPAPRVRGNHARLGQVFVNLLVNAIQAIPEGDPDHHLVRVATSTDAAGRAVVEVSDTGRGIPEAMRERIFDPFYTARDNGGSGGGTGTGLGLAVCHSIVHQLGGEITFESAIGGGTTFRVTLPSDLKAPPVVAGPTAASRRRRVLIVDDETGVGRALQRVLRHYEGVIATTGEEALAQLHGGEFDVVFCDVNLPDIDGLTVFERARALRPPLAHRFVFITGGVLDGGLAAAIERSGAPVVEKPFDLRRVRDIVEQIAGPG